MVQGCSSWAGKSLLVTALCRWYARQGVRVAPFKAQNMANNARVVDGGEIGSAQWLQARAAGVDPDVRMNPVLLKPEHGKSQVVRMGKVDHELSRRAWEDRSAALWPTIVEAYTSLSSEFDVIVIEGAGSPAEINLTANDIVNMRVAELADAPVLLAVDIDRGGAFAHLYGTWALLHREHRERIKGFILNRFRGDPALLQPGPADLQKLTGVPTVGVVPMLQHDLPDEDGAALHAPRRGGRPSVAIVRYPTASNLDEFTSLEQVADVGWATGPWQLHDSLDLIILPGSKDVPADLAWLRAAGFDDVIRRRAAEGVAVLGICGGLQMLGWQLRDGDEVTDGLGLLPVSTAYEREKLTRIRRVTLPGTLKGRWRALCGRTVEGYEIRHGGSGALVTSNGNVAGWYLHGVLDDPEVLHAMFGARPSRTLEDTFDALADAVEEHLADGLSRSGVLVSGRDDQ